MKLFWPLEKLATHMVYIKIDIIKAAGLRAGIVPAGNRTRI
jgi:hypothetical protein